MAIIMIAIIMLKLVIFSLIIVINNNDNDTNNDNNNASSNNNDSNRTTTKVIMIIVNGSSDNNTDSNNKSFVTVKLPTGETQEPKIKISSSCLEHFPNQIQPRQLVELKLATEYHQRFLLLEGTKIFLETNMLISNGGESFSMLL